MTKYQLNIHEVLDGLVNFRDTYDWDIAGIVIDLRIIIQNALMLPEVHANPNVKKALESIFADIEKIIDVLEDPVDDFEYFRELELYGHIDAKKFKKKVFDVIDDLEKLRAFFSKENMKNISKDTQEEFK